MVFNTIYLTETVSISSSLPSIYWNVWDLDRDMIEVHLPYYSDINSSGNSMFVIAKVPLLF